MEGTSKVGGLALRVKALVDGLKEVSHAPGVIEDIFIGLGRRNGAALVLEA